MGKYTINLSNGSAAITDKNVRDCLNETLFSAQYSAHSIKLLSETATTSTYDIDLDGTADLHIEYTATEMKIQKVNTCSLKTDVIIVLSTAAMEYLNKTETPYYSTIALRLSSNATSPTPMLPSTLAPDSTAVGKGASAAAAEAAITSLPDDNDPSGSTFAPLHACSTKQNTKSITLKWKKANNAKKVTIQIY